MFSRFVYCLGPNALTHIILLWWSWIPPLEANIIAVQRRIFFYFKEIKTLWVEYVYNYWKNIYTLPNVHKMFQIVYCRLAEFFSIHIWVHILPWINECTETLEFLINDEIDDPECDYWNYFSFTHCLRSIHLFCISPYNPSILVYKTGVVHLDSKKKLLYEYGGKQNEKIELN